MISGTRLLVDVCLQTNRSMAALEQARLGLLNHTRGNTSVNCPARLGSSLNALQGLPTTSIARGH